MCSVPVTFGGGNWMQKAGAPARIDGLNRPLLSQYEYHRVSIARGSKLLASSIGEGVLNGRVRPGKSLKL